MFFQKTASKGEVKGVSYLNGQVKFQGVSLNVYCFVTDGVLIDTGSHSLRKHFIPFIDQSDIDQVRITHFHEDHTGCASYIEKTKRIPIYINQKSIEVCESRANYPLYRQFFWGRRRPFQGEAMTDTFTSRTANWDAIDTPGHAFDHKAFLNRETGQLFTGDLYVTDRTRLVLAEENIPQIIASLELLLTYDFQDMFCNHRGFIANGREALERKLAYLHDIKENVLALNEAGNTVDVIHQKLFPQKYPITKFSNGEWDSIHIVKSILRHK